MADDFEDEGGRKRKKKGKPLLSRKQAGFLAAVIIIVAAGALFEYFVIEPLLEEGYQEKYARCLTQKDVLDERYVQSSSELQACEYQLGQCLGTS